MADPFYRERHEGEISSSLTNRSSIAGSWHEWQLNTYGQGRGCRLDADCSPRYQFGEIIAAAEYFFYCNSVIKNCVYWLVMECVEALRVNQYRC